MMIKGGKKEERWKRLKKILTFRFPVSPKAVISNSDRNSIFKSYRLSFSLITMRFFLGILHTLERRFLHSKVKLSSYCVKQTRSDLILLLMASVYQIRD